MTDKFKSPRISDAELLRRNAAASSEGSVIRFPVLSVAFRDLMTLLSAFSRAPQEKLLLPLARVM